jgi:hypothetical protein
MAAASRKRIVSAVEQHWDKVVADFRQLCLLRRQKKWIESDMILNSDLPRGIASWSEVSEGAPAQKKARLDAMFQAEQRRMDDAFFAMDLVTARLNDEIVPAICGQIAEQVRSAIMAEVQSAISNQLKAAVADEVRSAIPEHVRSSAPTPEANRAIITEQVRAAVAENVRAALAPELLSDFTEQALSTVAQQARAVVLEELARERKPTGPLRNVDLAAGRGSRVAFDDVPGVIDLVLAEEQQSENKNKLELSACP